MKLRTGRRFFLATLVLSLALIGCTSSEDQQEKYFQRAQELYDTGDYKKARVELRNVLQLNTNHTKGRYLAALMYGQDNDFGKMSANLQLAVDNDPTFVDARIKLGQLSYRYGPRGFDQALEQADAILDLDPGNADAHTLRGSVFFRRQETEDAISEANKALASEPGHVGATSVLAEVYKREDPARSLAIIEDSLQKDPTNTTLKTLKIGVLSQQGDTEGTIVVYKELIAAEPDNFDYIKMLVALLRQTDRNDEAEDILLELVSRNPDDVQFKLWLTQFLANRHGLEKAVSTLKGYIADQPDQYDFRFALSTLYLSQQLYPQAEEVLNEIVALDGDGTSALKARNTLAGMNLMFLGNRVRAEELLDEIFEIEPQNTAALTLKSQLLLNDGEAQAAIIHLRTVLKDNPESVPALRILARAHLANDSKDLALDTYRTALEVSPYDKDTVLAAAKFLIIQDRYSDADSLLENYLAKYPGIADVSQLLIESYGKQKRWLDALEVAAVLSQQESTRTLGLFLEGRLQFAREDYSASATAFEEVVKLQPDNSEALSYLLKAQLKLGENKKAQEYLTSHIERYPEQPAARELQGSLYMHSNNINAAIESYKAALLIDPNRINTHVALAQVLQAHDDPQSALESFDAAIKLAPQSPELLILKAGVLEGQKQHKEAVTAYEAALAIDKDQKLAANNLAMLLVDEFPSKENFDRALEITSEFEDSEIPTFLDTRGWVHYQAGDYSSALEVLVRAVAAENAESVFHYHLGMTYYKLGKKGLAKTELEAALEINDDFPGSDEAVRLLKRI